MTGYVMSEEEKLLKINNLNLSIHRSSILKNIHLSIERGKTIALVGESGSGKSMIAKSIMGLQPNVEGEILFKKTNLLALNKNEFEKIRGNKIGFICQNPMTALNPTLTIGDQITEVLIKHCQLTKQQAFLKAEELVYEVGLSDPKKRLLQYPDQLSGGMKQRIIIAIAISCVPDLLIADEPTTSLDTTTQAQIFQLLKKIQDKYKMGMLLITHDLGLVAGCSDKIYIIKEGGIIDYGDLDYIFYQTKNNDTKDLCWKRI